MLESISQRLHTSSGWKMVNSKVKYLQIIMFCRLPTARCYMACPVKVQLGQCYATPTGFLTNRTLN